jgi:acyl transferase domain-containing protein
MSSRLPELGRHGSGARRVALAEFAKAVAPVALKVRPLSMRWPLHTSLMGPVAEALEHHHSLIGRLRPFRHPVYCAVHAGRLSAPEEGWRLRVDHLSRPQRFDLAFEAARRDGHADCVEPGPCGTLEHAVRFLDRDEVEIECFPTASAPVRRRTVRQW